jgi:hypothetical protein
MASRAIGTAVGEWERSLSPFPGASAIGLKKRFEPARWAFIIGTAVMLVTFLGFYSLEPGGNPLTKFHPATYLLVLAAWFALCGKRNDGGMIRLFRDSPALAWAIAMIAFCMVYSVFCVGLNGGAVYIDTFLAAMLTAVALDDRHHVPAAGCLLRQLPRAGEAASLAASSGGCRIDGGDPRCVFRIARRLRRATH